MVRRHSFRTGPFLVSLGTDDPALLATVREFYPDLFARGDEGIHSFHVQMHRARGLRRWRHPQILFRLDDASPFEPYPLDHGFPLLEWGLNWCIAMRAHQYLMLHSAVVERAGRALILPALPGSGKSTLCAALSLGDWRLLSDEFGLCDLEGGAIIPLPRPVPLKNESISIILAYSGDAHLGPLYPRTRKGDIRHMRPPGDSLLRQDDPAKPTWIVFPCFRKDAAARLQQLPKSEAFVRLAQNAFNYSFLMDRGFNALTRLVSDCDCYSLEYGSLADAIAALDSVCAV